MSAHEPGAIGARGGGFLHAANVASLLALVALAVAWELSLAPLRPGGSWLALKAVPLLLPLKGVLAGRLYTYRWAMMLVLAYFAEGCVRLYSEKPPASTLALIELALCVTFFVTAIACVRRAR